MPRRRTPHRNVHPAIIAVISSTILLAATCSSDGEAAQEGAKTTSTTTTDPPDDGSGSNAGVTEATASETYADATNWLCRPGVEGDACDIDLDATLVDADGTQTVESFEPAVDAPVDCFYVYPTISTDEGANSDLEPGDPEIGVAGTQAARFGEVCNVYAPVYRQTPLGAMFDRLSGDEEGSTTTTLAEDDPTAPRNIAYGDVRDAFLHYLAEDNDGRPFVLIGHSQGSGHLNRLIAEEIDPDPGRLEQLQSALLIGSSVAVGGDDPSFETVPACETPTDTGCVVSYASFYASEPPPADSLFGRVRQGDGRALCTNPGDLANSGPAPLSSYFGAGHSAEAPQVTTPFIHYQGLVTGECVSTEDLDWLELTNTATPGSPLPADLGGRLTPEWGTHLADMNFALGDLVELVRTQSGQT